MAETKKVQKIAALFGVKLKGKGDSSPNTITRTFWHTKRKRQSTGLNHCKRKAARATIVTRIVDEESVTLPDFKLPLKAGVVVVVGVGDPP